MQKDRPGILYYVWAVDILTQQKLRVGAEYPVASYGLTTLPWSGSGEGGGVYRGQVDESRDSIYKEALIHVGFLGVASWGKNSNSPVSNPSSKLRLS